MKKQTKGHLSFDLNDLKPYKKEKEGPSAEQYGKAAAFAIKNRSFRIGTAMRVFRISSAEAQKLVKKLQNDGVIDQNCNVPKNTKMTTKNRL